VSVDQPSKELPEIDRCSAQNTVPDNGGDPILDALLDREPVEDITHKCRDVAKLRDTTN
jgi:hypothetical protein